MDCRYGFLNFKLVIEHQINSNNFSDYVRNYAIFSGAVLEAMDTLPAVRTQRMGGILLVIYFAISSKSVARILLKRGDPVFPKAALKRFQFLETEYQLEVNGVAEA